MKNYLTLLGLMLLQAFAMAQPSSYDWYRAPENPFTPDQLQRIDREGKFFGKVLVVGNKWFDRAGNLLNTNILNDRNLASTHNATSVDRDGQGRIITEISYTAGKAETKTYEYDVNGNMLSWMATPSNKKTVYTYDDRDRVIKSVYSSETFEYTTVYTYNNKGKTLVIDKNETNKDGVLVNHYIKEYREGMIRSSEEVGQGKNTFTYEFDDEYNWVKRFKNGSKYPDDVRTINYYKNFNDPDLIQATIIKNKYGKPIIEVILDGIPLKTSKFEKFHVVYNPIQQQYFKIENTDQLLVPENIGKSLELIGLGKNSPLLKAGSQRYVHGARKY